MTPIEVVAGVLRHRDEGDVYATARRVIAALGGHQMLASGNTGTASAQPAAAKMKTAAAPARCANPVDPHRGTALDGGRCPICQWSA